MDSLRAYIENRSIPEPNSGCWLWLLSVGSHGYGNASMPTKRVTTAPRAAFQAFKGHIPPGMLIQHSCDNKLCVNPDHLSLGTDKSNAVDKQIKGRAAKRLTADDVVAIRAAYGSGYAIRALARDYNVNQGTIQMVVRRKTWAHV